MTGAHVLVAIMKVIQNVKLQNFGKMYSIAIKRRANVQIYLHVHSNSEEHNYYYIHQ